MGDRDFNKTVVACDSIVTCWTRPATELLDQVKAAGMRVVNVGDSGKNGKEGSWDR